LKALITGVAGFIGSHVAESLLADGWEVLGVDNFDPFYDPGLKRENIRALRKSKAFKLVEADIQDREQLESAVGSAKLDAIVHLAARAGVRPSIELPKLYADVNVSGTVEVLELARRREVPRFVFASSSSVYGEREGSPFREEDNVDHPISPYAATKKAGELIGYTYHHLYGLPIFCLRFFTVYGPRQRPEMAIHKFARAIAEGEPITLYGDGTSRRDYTYIDDIVAGVVAAIDRVKGYRIYNLGNHRTVELRELIRLIEEDLGKKANVKHMPAQPGDVPLTCADIQRAQEELGYNPGVPIERGLELFVEWFEKKNEKKKRPRRKTARESSET
jgi:UDP-glucuronate 4-epimerase